MRNTYKDAVAEGDRPLRGGRHRAQNPAEMAFGLYYPNDGMPMIGLTGVCGPQAALAGGPWIKTEVSQVGGTHVLDRWLYRGKRPNYLARALNRAWAGLAAVGLSPARLVTLEVRGRRTGRTISLPVVVADYRGERYLVSMLGGDANWVRNVRAAGGRAVLRHGHRQPVRLEEVDPGERAEILRRYLECSPGARSHIPVGRGAAIQEYEAIAGRFPVFRLKAEAGEPAGG